MWSSQTKKEVPKLLAREIIVLTGQFNPYSKNQLKKMCQELGASCPVDVSGRTTALLQGGQIVQMGRLIQNRDISTTKNSIQARKKGIKIIQNHKLQDFFKLKTGKSISQLMKLINDQEQQVNQITNNKSSTILSQYSKPLSHYSDNNHCSRPVLANQTQYPFYKNPDKKQYPSEKQTNQTNIKPSTIQTKQIQCNNDKEIMQSEGWKRNQQIVKKMTSKLQETKKSNLQFKQLENKVVKLESRNFQLQIQVKRLKQQLKLKSQKEKQKLSVSTDSIDKPSQSYSSHKFLIPSINLTSITHQKPQFQTSYQQIHKKFTSILQFSNYKFQIQQLIFQTKKLMHKCYNIYQNTIKKVEQMNRNYNERGNDQQLHERLIENGTYSDENCEQNDQLQRIHGISNKKCKKQQLLQKKSQKRQILHSYKQQSQLIKPSIHNQIQHPASQQPIISQQEQSSSYRYKHPYQQCNNNKQSQYLPPEEFLLNYFNDQEEIKLRYKKKVIAESNLSFKQQAQRYQLKLHKIRLDIKEFVKYDWTQVQILSLNQCNIDNQGWLILVKNAITFKNLKFLSICKFLSYTQSSFQHNFISFPTTNISFQVSFYNKFRNKKQLS